MGPPAHEAASVGDHRPDGGVVDLEPSDPVEHVVDPRRRQVEEADVVLAQVGPPARRIGEGRLETGPETAGRTGVHLETDHADRRLECRVVEPAHAVDHDDDLRPGKLLDLEEGPDHVAGQSRPHVREYDGGDVGLGRRETDCCFRVRSDRPLRRSHGSVN